MKPKLLVSLLCLMGMAAAVVFGYVLPDKTQVRHGTTNTTVGAGVLTNAELGWLPANGTLWIGTTNNGVVIVGKAGVATTGDINTATGSLASTTFVNSAVAPLASTTFVNNAISPLASTTFVNSAVSGLTTNLTLLDGNTNSFTVYITNGLWKGVSQP